MNKFIPDSYVLLWLILLMGIFTYFCVHHADDYAYSPDEAMLNDIAGGKDMHEVLTFSRYESHPPLGNFLRHAWMQFSVAPWFVRSESLVFGLGTIVLYFLLGNLLAGRLAGMCAALIVATSRGLIIQSYVARNYIFFFFFISACFYCFMHWRKYRRLVALAGYAAFGCLAGATHFSALFSVLCMGAAETFVMLKRKAALREWMLWLAANAVIAIIIGALYVAWLPMLRQLALYFSTMPLGLAARLEVMLLAPFGLAIYLFPGTSYAITLTFFFLVCAIWPGSAARKDTDLHFLIALAAVSILLGMLLFITDIYSPVGGRHNLWIFPFIIPLLGCLMADTCAKVATKPGSMAKLMVLLFTVFLSMYNADDRFSDASEYGMTHNDRFGVESFFATLGPRDLIVMERDDAVMFSNLYPLLGDTPFTGTPRAALVSYGNTHILYDPFFRRIYTETLLATMFSAAQSAHMLDETDRLVFFYSLWPHSIAAQLMSCPSLAKEVVIFPRLDHPPSGMEIHQARAALMAVSKHTFLNDVLSPLGKAHACLEQVP